MQCGTPWGAWKSVFATNNYSSDGIVVGDIEAFTEKDVTLDNAIDNIEFISNYSEEMNLQMDVTKLKDTELVEVSEETDDVFINESGLLKLAILEIKKLKEEIKIFKAR